MKKYQFRNWLRNWLVNFDSPGQDDDCRPTLTSGKTIISAKEEFFSGEPLRISVYSASGGFIIESRTYDRHKDRINANLYIVNDDKDLGHEMSRIITMASLSR